MLGSKFALKFCFGRDRSSLKANKRISYHHRVPLHTLVDFLIFFNFLLVSFLIVENSRGGGEEVEEATSATFA